MLNLEEFEEASLESLFLRLLQFFCNFEFLLNFSYLELRDFASCFSKFCSGWCPTSPKFKTFANSKVNDDELNFGFL